MSIGLIASVSIGFIAFAVLFVVVCVAITLAVYYAVSGEWLWEKDRGNSDSRNWSPPR
jgi:uncharacterized SAM-binding protein YcdF (DUF218 family)